MNKTERLDAINNHPQFDANRLADIAQNKLTNAILWQYICELEDWHPLEVVATTNPDWYLVASSSEIGFWHKTSAIHQSCDCLAYGNTKCCHLAAVEKHEETAWIDYAKQYGFTVSVVDGKYQIKDHNVVVGELLFCDNKWLLKEPRLRDCLVYEGIHEAIEYLVAVVSFGSQLGTRK